MKSNSRIASLLITVALVAAVFFSLAHAQAIEDWIRLRGYNPPAKISSLAAEDTMTSYATHVFYVNHPVTADVLSGCNQSEQTIVLGCYHGAQTGIEIKNVADRRLDGVEEVTAAHEMLHAAYDRLNSGEKRKIDAMLLDYYNHGLKDQRIIDTMNSYRKSEPNDVVNEMHSVFGTEIAALPTGLESYYQKYFNDRSKITAFAANYEGEFTSRTAQIDADDAQLAAMRAQIRAEEQSLQSQLAALQADRVQVENSNNNGDIAAYNSRVAAYNAGVRKLDSDIKTFNSLVEQRNTLAAELKSLQSSLETNLQAQPSQ
jgi:hypothetical protein